MKKKILFRKQITWLSLFIMKFGFDWNFLFFIFIIGMFISFSACVCVCVYALIDLMIWFVCLSKEFAFFLIFMHSFIQFVDFVCLHHFRSKKFFALKFCKSSWWWNNDVFHLWQETKQKTEMKQNYIQNSLEKKTKTWE